MPRKSPAETASRFCYEGASTSRQAVEEQAKPFLPRKTRGIGKQVSEFTGLNR